MSAKMILPLAAAALLALGACSHKTDADASATANSAMNDTIDNINSMASTTGNVGDSMKPGLDAAGNSLDNAASATGNAMSNAGNTLSNSM